VQEVVDELGEGNWQLITASEETTVRQILEIMKTNRIISVPVQNQKTGEFLGICDMLDLVTFCTAKFSSVSLLAEDSYRQMEEFAEKPVKHILHASGRNSLANISSKAPLNDLMIFLSKSHRVAVVNEKKEVIGMLTQSKLLEFLWKRKSDYSDVMQEKLNKFQKPVESINMKKFVIEAFTKIWEKEVTGLAVVDDDGKLVGNISATDLLHTRVSPIGELIHDLYEPIKTFMNIRSDMNDRVMMADLPETKPVAVMPADTLAMSIRKCLDCKVHRVFIQDNTRTPVGVISLTDIIQQFAVQI